MWWHSLRLTAFELRLWLCSMGVVTLSSLLGGVDVATLLVSLLGMTALIYVAKGHVLGQVLTAVFGLFYGLISYQCAYYGEMVTYMGMTTPMALLATVSWLKNPYEQGRQEVKVASFGKRDCVKLLSLTIVVTVVFFCFLRWLDTANLPLSTLSISTSFAAAYLTYRRSPYYALAYALNDLVLIGLWIWAALGDATYLTMVACFVMFFANDLYGYHNWQVMQKRQSNLE